MSCVCTKLCVCRCESADNNNSNNYAAVSTKININTYCLTALTEQRSNEEQSDAPTSKGEAEKEGGDGGDRGEKSERNAEELRAAKEREEPEYRRVMQPLQYDETPQLSRYHFM
jgi:hypothetical protein